MSPERAARKKIYDAQWEREHRAVRNEKNRKWRLENIEYDRARCRLKYHRRKEQQSLVHRLWRLRNKEKRQAYAKKWLDQNPAKRAAYREKNANQYKTWRRENRERFRVLSAAHCHKRRALKKAATLGDPKLIVSWMREIRSKPFVRCHWCGTKVSGKAIHFDHVIALGAGGTHEIGNLCASCPDCNLSKQDKSPSEWSVNQQVFLHL